MLWLFLHLTRKPRHLRSAHGGISSLMVISSACTAIEGLTLNPSWLKNCEIAGIQKVRTTPYHSRENSVKRFNRTFLNMLGTLETKSKTHWQEVVKPLLRTCNWTRNDMTGARTTTQTPSWPCFRTTIGGQTWYIMLSVCTDFEISSQANLQDSNRENGRPKQDQPRHTCDSFRVETRPRV